ncbi:jupiter microtubule associated homolog 1 isoform X2 [Bufo gargarizans]|uniref:jupiter microtubule associated homolog 1 isoform X2 n=1 Tax=Bufo gargarizans TaxID=30331 RepID=UPI001CF2491B|nr:jupiter microtubule associated homolog 1 isoform X2 [Bufo gargarizans]
MTTTSMFQGLDPDCRSSSRVLRPPGGGSSFVFGEGAKQQQQPARRHMMASNIFGIPDNEPAPTSCASEPGVSESAACGDDPHRTCTEDEYSDATEHTEGEAEEPETEPAKEACGEPAQPAPPVAVPSRRNPPGGKSSLVLG